MKKNTQTSTFILRIFYSFTYYWKLYLSKVFVRIFTIAMASFANDRQPSNNLNSMTSKHSVTLTIPQKELPTEILFNLVVCKCVRLRVAFFTNNTNLFVVQWLRLTNNLHLLSIHLYIMDGVHFSISLPLIAPNSWENL